MDSAQATALFSYNKRGTSSASYSGSIDADMRHCDIIKTIKGGGQMAKKKAETSLRHHKSSSL